MQTLWTLVLILGFHSAHPVKRVEEIGIKSQQACFMSAVKKLAKIHSGDIAISCVPSRGVEI
jgi:hypothetical protein